MEPLLVLVIILIVQFACGLLIFCKWVEKHHFFMLIVVILYFINISTIMFYDYFENCLLPNKRVNKHNNPK